LKYQEDNAPIQLENAFTYKLINAEGTIQDLHCNRYYNFTKYLEIDDSYFGNCYATFIPEDSVTADNNNVWISEHLTSEDLDVMTNEIYAEYGLKFKTSKWQNYFSQFSWYKPQFNNVDSKLTKMDKKNIETIAKEKAKMKGKENDYVNKHKGQYYEAG
jgi:YARHG domain